MLVIVSCPNEEIIDAFVDHSKWAELANDPNGAKFVAFIHLSPSSVLAHPKYIAWMMKFGAAADVSCASAFNSLSCSLYRLIAYCRQR